MLIHSWKSQNDIFVPFCILPFTVLSISSHDVHTMLNKLVLKSDLTLFFNNKKDEGGNDHDNEHMDNDDDDDNDKK